MKNISAAFLIIGSFIGAGFSTGKEIFVFYGMYGFVGLLNLLLSMILIYFVIYNYLYYGKLKNISNFKQVSIIISKKPIIIDIILLTCFFIVTSALFAGLNEFDNYLNINSKFKIVGLVTLIFAILCSIGGLKSLSKISNIVVPIIIFMFMFICCYSIFTKKFQIGEFTFKNNYIVSICNGISYVGYNTILSSQLFFSISKKIKDIRKVTILTVSIFLILLLLGTLAIITSDTLIMVSQMPLLNIAIGINGWVGYVYLIVMWFAIITTLLSNIYSITGYLKNYFKNDVLIIIFVCVTCYLISFVGFGNIIEFLYPLIGAFGIFYYLMLFAKFNIKKNAMCFANK